ncbi:unnamed protein product, partial [Allacma fusca]
LSQNTVLKLQISVKTFSV